MFRLGFLPGSTLSPGLSVVVGAGGCVAVGVAVGGGSWRTGRPTPVFRAPFLSSLSSLGASPLSAIFSGSRSGRTVISETADIPARVPDGTVVIGKNSDGSSNTPDCRQNQ